MIISFFDCETLNTYQELGIFNKYQKTPDKLKLAIGGILFHNTESKELNDKHMFFGEPGVLSMISLLKQSDLIIGHNIIRFDFPLIQQYTNENLTQLLSHKTFDTLIELEKVTGIWTSLDDLCKRNLGEGKNEDSAKIPEMWRSGDYSRVEKYLLNDLKKTRDIYLYIKKNKKVKFMMKDYGREVEEREVEVEW